MVPRDCNSQIAAEKVPGSTGLLYLLRCVGRVDIVADMVVAVRGILVLVRVHYDTGDFLDTATVSKDGRLRVSARLKQP